MLFALGVVRGKLGFTHFAVTIGIDVFKHATVPGVLELAALLGAL